MSYALKQVEEIIKVESEEMGYSEKEYFKKQLYRIITDILGEDEFGR